MLQGRELVTIMMMIYSLAQMGEEEVEISNSVIVEREGLKASKGGERLERCDVVVV